MAKHCDVYEVISANVNFVLVNFWLQISNGFEADTAVSDI